jgi:hypothetical protein
MWPYRLLVWRAAFSKTLLRLCLCIGIQQGAGEENASTLNSMVRSHLRIQGRRKEAEELDVEAM